MGDPYNAAAGHGIDPDEWAAAVEEGYLAGGAGAAEAYLAGVDAANELERTPYEPWVVDRVNPPADDDSGSTS